jgi:hypothetical protein
MKSLRLSKIDLTMRLFRILNTICVLAVLASVPGTWGAKCAYDSASYHIMPKEIGRENEIFKSPYLLPCDSMVVPSGQTTTIYEFSMLHFGTNPSPESKIEVKGTLIIKGKAERPVYFSGSIKQGETGYAPADARWDGIVIDSGGSVQSRYARIFNAPTPMVVLSKNVFMVNTFFQGASGIILPDTSISIGRNGMTMDTMDLRPGKPKHPATASSADVGAPKRERKGGRIGTGKKVAYYTLGGTALIAVGGLAFWALNGSDKKSPQPPDQSGLDPDPDYPSVPSRRQ